MAALYCISGALEDSLDVTQWLDRWLGNIFLWKEANYPLTVHNYSATIGILLSKNDRMMRSAVKDGQERFIKLFRLYNK